MTHSTKTRISILGAGTIGCFIGGKLLNAGYLVNFIGRDGLGNRICKSGMELTTYEGHRNKIDSDLINWSSQPQALKNSNIILLCTKSGGTENAARLIKKHCSPDVTVISVQNGIGNTSVIKNMLPHAEVLSAMVSFNVVRLDETPVRFHQGTEGEIVFEHHVDTQNIANSLKNNGVNSSISNQMQSISWGKLLLNLNNAINTISGLPLKQQLQTSGWRKILALSVAEALAVLRQSDIKPAKIGKVPPTFIPLILRLPNWAFDMVAQSMLKIDENARSSMWEDLQAGRNPEIDYLNGAVCELGKQNGIATPVNDAILKLVKELFAQDSPVHHSAAVNLTFIVINQNN